MSVPKVTTNLKPRTYDVAYAWRDPEFWGPKGRGCNHCHEGLPLVTGLPFGALCERCFLSALPGWDFEQAVTWLGKQREALIRQGRRAAAMKAWRERGALALALDYKRDYGVWLLERPEP